MEYFPRWDLSTGFARPVVLISHGFLDMKMPDPRPTFAYLATALRDKHPKLAHLHVVEPRLELDFGAEIASIAGQDNDFLREIWKSGVGGEERVFISAGGYTRETALHTAKDKGGLVAFGRLFISNVRADALVTALFAHLSI